MLCYHSTNADLAIGWPHGFGSHPACGRGLSGRVVASPVRRDLKALDLVECGMTDFDEAIRASCPAVGSQIDCCLMDPSKLR